MENRNEYIRCIEIEYLKSIYGFAMKRTHTYDEAEELAGEIVYQVMSAIHRVEEITHFEAFVWRVAHNTYKKWLHKQKRKEAKEQILEDTETIIGIGLQKSLEHQLEQDDTLKLLRRELALLTKSYREVMVSYYIENQSCKAIANNLNLSEQMVKFYLAKGREKVREGMDMYREYGEKSYNPSPFSVYLAGSWNSEHDLWQVLSKKLPSNIILAAYDKPVTLSELSLDTGVPTVFLEEEVLFLMQLELLIEVAKGKYQTNIFVAKKGLVEQMNERIKMDQKDLAMKLEAQYLEIRNELLKIDLFGFEVSEERYRWFFIQKIFLQVLLEELQELEYIPSEKTMLHQGFIAGIEDYYPRLGFGVSTCEGEGYIANRCDFIRWIEERKSVILPERLKKLRQRDLTQEKIQRLIAIKRQGKVVEEEKEALAQLVEGGYLTYHENGLKVNLPLITTEQEAALVQLLRPSMDQMILSIHKSMVYTQQLFNRVTPKHLRPNLVGYAYLISMAQSMSYLLEELYGAGFMMLPEEGDNTPYTSYIVLK